MTTEHLLRKARKKMLSLTNWTPLRSELNLKPAFSEYQPQFIVLSLILDVFGFCFFSQNPKPNKTFTPCVIFYTILIHSATFLLKVTTRNF